DVRQCNCYCSFVNHITRVQEQMKTVDNARLAAAMATRTRKSRSVTGHTSVSNEREEALAETVGKPVSTPPSEGPNPSTGKVSKDGAEAVGNYKRTEAAVAELFTAPAGEGLRDIGEASFGPPPALIETVHGPDDRVQITNTS